MKFGKPHREEPEINLVAFIDVLLVVLIFLMLSTTYNRLMELPVRLPHADAQRAKPVTSLELVIGPDGRYALGQQVLASRHPDALVLALQTLVQNQTARVADRPLVLAIHADGAAPHQSVITAMEAARRAGIAQVNFVAQSGGSGR